MMRSHLKKFLMKEVLNKKQKNKNKVISYNLFYQKKSKMKYSYNQKVKNLEKNGKIAKMIFVETHLIGRVKLMTKYN